MGRIDLSPKTLIRRARIASRERSTYTYTPVSSPGSTNPTSKSILFFRHLPAFRGGHLKAWHYFNHVMASPEHVPYVNFSIESVWDERNPWAAMELQRLPGVQPRHPDAYFVGGPDWIRIPLRAQLAGKVPIINLVQGIRHTDPDLGLYRLLANRAIRICVSSEVADALMATGRVNGPMFTIPNSIDSHQIRSIGRDTPREHETDVVVLANKKPEMGARIAETLRAPGREVTLLDRLLPHREFLGEIARARVAVFLPQVQEGFYLPALEAMALETLVVCPDVVGNRSFCIPDVNSFRPAYDEGQITRTALEAITLSEERRRAMIAAASDTVLNHDVARERRAFLEILSNIDALWASG